MISSYFDAVFGFDKHELDVYMQKSPFVTTISDKHFGQKSKRAYVYNTIDSPHPSFNVVCGNTCAQNVPNQQPNIV
jgi:hypothetical protein